MLGKEKGKGNKMIKVICQTNLDDYQKEYWPDFMSCRPQLGDWVRSRSGRELKIVKITHATNKTTEQPMLLIELWKSS